jgi:hypothetical protein
MKTKSKLSAYILRGSTTALLFSCVIVALCSAIHLPEQPAKALAPQDNAVFGANAHQGATLSFTERVAYQRAIEDGWVPTGSLVAARTRHTATLLPNGKVLVAGGNDGHALSSAELYDPASGTWTATGSMGTARERPTATLLPNGKVLVAGGALNELDAYLSSAELYDPATGTWAETGRPIQLTRKGKRIGGINTSRLKWRGATSANIDVYRDGVVIATTPNDGLYDDSTGTTGQASFMYQVCEAGTGTCSNVVIVQFPE